MEGHRLLNNSNHNQINIKKIAIISSLYTYGGVQSCVISLIKGLNSNGIIPYLISDLPLNEKIVTENKLLLNYYFVEYSISRNLANILSPFLGGALDLVYFLKTKKFNNKFDFLYIFHPNIVVNSRQKHLYYLSMAPKSIGYSGKTFKSKIKFFFYEKFIKNILPIYEFGDKERVCVINSNYTRKLFYESYKRDLDVVYPPTKINNFREDAAKFKNGVVFFSRLTKYKRPEDVIKLAEKFPHVNFTIMGAADDLKYSKYIEDLIRNSNSSNISLIINVSNQRAIEILRSCKIFLFCARNEHFGMATVEAMSLGAIPFVHDSGGQREIVPWPNLRYNDYDINQKFEALLKMDLKEQNLLKSSISSHVYNFSEEIYLNKIMSHIRF